MVHLKKILHITNDKLYLLFTDGDVRVLLKESFNDLPDWQKDIVENYWKQVKVDEFGGLVFNNKFDIGGDTLKKDTTNIDDKELLSIIHSKKIAKKRIIQTLASLL